MTGAFEQERKKSARAIVQNRLAQNGYEQRDKHLIAYLIPISLTIVQQQAAPDAFSLSGGDPTAKRSGPSAGANSGLQPAKMELST
jgi:hypothetical protein